MKKLVNAYIIIVGDIMANRAYNNEKAEHAYKKFGTDLKENNFGPVLFLYGVEQYLVEWAVGALVKKYVNPAATTFDFVKIDEDDAPIDEMITACETFSMFSERKVVWLKNHVLLKTANPRGFSESDKQAILDYIASPSEQTILVISTEQEQKTLDLFKEIKAKSQCYNFSQLDRKQLVAFAEKRFKAAQVAIRKDVLWDMIEETGYFNKETDYRIFNLENDIKKVIAHSDGIEVKREDVSAALNGDMDTFIFNFLDAVSNKRKDTAFMIMHNMLGSGGSVYQILAMLVSQFELLLEAKEFKEDAMSLQEMAKTMKVNEFRLKKALQTEVKFTKAKLRDILSQLYEIDRNIKTGALDGNLALELLVGKI